MLSTKTKILYAVSALAPATLLLARMLTASEAGKAKGHTAAASWFEPGFIPYLFLFIGCLSFALAVVSTIRDIRGQ